MESLATQQKIVMHQILDKKQVELVEKTCRYLTAHLDRKCSLAGVALLMGTNRNRLAISFRVVAGCGVFEWLRDQRMIKAKYLLLHSNKSAQQIACDVGYSNSANFSTAFRRKYGVSPRQQRRNGLLPLASVEGAVNTPVPNSSQH